MIKKLLVSALILFSSQLSFAYPKQIAFPPFQIAGNLYYVGNDDLASYLIVTPEGNILINSNLESDVPMLKKNIETLGFKYMDTKILLISHAHFDHAAGSEVIKEQTKAKYRVMDADVSLVESGGKSDFHYAQDRSMYFPATTVDKILHDGEQVKLGGAVLTAHLTPGHTKGCTTWTMPVIDHGKPHEAIFLGSLSVNPGYKLVDNNTYPNIAEDYKHSFKVLKSLRGDIFLGAHAGYFDLAKKYSQLKNTAVNPFIDRAGYEKYIAQKELDFNAEFERQKA